MHKGFISLFVAGVVFVAGCGGGDNGVRPDSGGGNMVESPQPDPQPDPQPVQRGPGYVTSASQANTAIAAILSQINIGDTAGGTAIRAYCTRLSARVCDGRYPVSFENVGYHPDHDSFSADLSQVAVSVPGFAGMNGHFSGQSDGVHSYGGWGDWHYFVTFYQEYEEGGYILLYGDAHAPGVLPAGDPPIGTATYKGFTSARRIEVLPSGGMSPHSDAGEVTIIADLAVPFSTLDISLDNFQGHIPELANGVRWRNVDAGPTGGFAKGAGFSGEWLRDPHDFRRTEPGA